MTEIQEKAVKIVLRSYGNGCMSDEEFIDILNAILCRDEPNRFPYGLINTPGTLTTRDIANPTANPNLRPGDVWVDSSPWVTYTTATNTYNENSNTSLNKDIKDVKISDYTKQTIFKD